MQTIKDLFGNYQVKEVVKSRRTERGDLLTEFQSHNIKDKDGKVLDIRAIAVFLSPIKTCDLYLLRDKCNGAKSYEACFWYHVKPKKEEPY